MNTCTVTPATDQRAFLGIEEAAQYLRVTPRTIYRLITSGKLKPHRPTPRRPLFTAEQLEQYVLAN